MDKLVSFENTYQGEEDGNRFVCIDGYPEDENASGEVIAMVWQTPHGDFVVDWHDNAYRDNEYVKELIEEGKKILTTDRYEQFLSVYDAYEQTHGQLNMSSDCIYGVRDKCSGESGWNGKAYDVVAFLEYNYDKEYRIVYRDPYLEHNEDIQGIAEHLMAELTEGVREGTVPKLMESDQFVFENHRTLRHSVDSNAKGLFSTGTIEAITPTGRSETIATVLAANQTNHAVKYHNAYFEGSKEVDREVKALVNEMYPKEKDAIELE